MAASFRGTSHILGDVTLMGRLVQARVGVLLEPYELTHAQAVALVRLWRSPTRSMTQASLIDSLAVSRAAGSQLLQDLQARGLVRRIPDETDARRQVVSLTKSGSDLESQVLGVFDQVEEEVVGKVRGRDRKHLASILTDMVDRARDTRELT